MNLFEIGERVECIRRFGNVGATVIDVSKWLVVVELDGGATKLVAPCLVKKI